MIATSVNQHLLDSDNVTAFVRDEPVDVGQGSSLESIIWTRRSPRRNVEVPRQLLPILPSLLSIIDLELVGNNWDGHGGKAASLPAIGAALDVLGRHPALLKPPSVAPRSDGGVHLEWAGSVALELDVEEDGAITVLIADGEDWLDFEFMSPADPNLHDLLSAVRS